MRAECFVVEILSSSAGFFSSLAFSSAFSPGFPAGGCPPCCPHADKLPSNTAAHSHPPLRTRIRQLLVNLFSAVRTTRPLHRIRLLHQRQSVRAPHSALTGAG